MTVLRGLATGIGSLPYKDPSAAVDKILSRVPRIPFWPQLPRRDAREGMLAQFIEGLPCLSMCGNDAVFSPCGRDEQLEHFYGHVIAQDTAPFAISADYAQGLHSFYQRLECDPSVLSSAEFIKCHITGPLTFAAGIKDEQDVALLHDDVMMQVIVAGLAMKALWQIRLFEKFGRKIIVFIDEPFLSAFGSAYTPLDRGTVVRTLGEITAAIRGAGALTGVHCCGNTDWSMFTDIETLDIINFDAFGFADKLVLYAPQVQNFLVRGGILCWGVVPTQDQSPLNTPAELAEKIFSGMSGLSRKGVDAKLLSERLLISPSCGLGSLSETSADGILRVLDETSSIMRKT